MYILIKDGTLKSISTHLISADGHESVQITEEQYNGLLNGTMEYVDGEVVNK